MDFIKPDRLCGPQTALMLIFNPVDYAACGALQQRVYHRRKFNTVEELKTAIITEWQELSRFIDSSISEWRRRRECVVKNGDGLDISNTVISLEHN